MTAQNSSSRSSKNAPPPVAAGPEADLNTLLYMPLKELVRLGGAKKGAEVLDYEYEGTDVRDERGRDLSVIVWRRPGQEVIEGLSITHMKHGAAKEVWQYSPAAHIDAETRKFMQDKLATAYELLAVQETFHKGITLLDGVRCLGRMREDRYQPKELHFRLSPAALSNQEQAVIELSAWLKFRGVKVGTIEASPGKKLPDLANEIRTGESELSYEDGEVIITSRVVLIEALRRNAGGELQRIVETLQRFDNGFEQVRRSFGGVPGEKQKPGESVIDTVSRGLNEELGVKKVRQISIGDPSQYLEQSSYPGLHQRTFYIPVTLTLHPSEVKDSYQERTAPVGGIAGKWTLLSWERVLEPSTAASSCPA